MWRPYAGYHVLASRIFALFQSAFPIQWAPQMLAWENAAIIAACAAYLFGFWWRLSEQAPLPMWTRSVLGLAFGLAPLLVPHLGEVFLSLANLQWLLSVIFLALLLDVFFVSPAQPTSSRQAGEIGWLTFSDRVPSVLAHSARQIDEFSLITAQTSQDAFASLTRRSTSEVFCSSA